MSESFFLKAALAAAHAVHGAETNAGTWRGIVMSQHPPAIFVADTPGLDFLNSIATPVETPVDWIADGAGYLNWLAQAGLVPAEVLRDMREQAAPGELDEVADQARKL